MKMVTFDGNFNKWAPGKRRRGRPRQHWLDHTLKRAFNTIRERAEDFEEWINSEEQRMEVIDAAFHREI